MGTKKKKAEPAKGKAKAEETAMLKPGDIWTHPDSGKKYVAEVGECDETCAFGCMESNKSHYCPITRDKNDKRPICIENGVHLVEVSDTKATKSKKPVEKSSDGVGRRYELVEVKRILPSPYQTRKHGDVSELAASIRTYGVLNPVTVRPVGDGYYEMIAGHRRREAAAGAELTVIPAIVIACDDQTAAEMCVTENMQRKDLSPLEEAEGVNALIGTGHTLDDIANRLGRTRQWVARRASLLRLTDAIKTSVESGNMRSASVESLEIMARMTPDVQTELARMWVGDYVPTASCIRSRAALKMRSLANPPFSVIACKTCTKRTGATPDLFDVVDGKLGECINADCYNGKRMAAKKTLVAELKRERPGSVIFTGDYELAQESGIPVRWSVTECGADAEGAVPAVNVLDSGEIKECFVVKREEDHDDDDDKPQEMPYQTRVEKGVFADVADMLADSVDKERTPFNKMLDAGRERQILRLLAVFGYYDHVPDLDTEGAAAFESASIDDIARKLWKGFVAYVIEIQPRFKEMVLIAAECGLATEKQLVELAKAELKTDGFDDPEEAAAQAPVKQKKGKK